MNSPQQAIAAIRHVVQDHGDAHTRLGRPAPIEGMNWFAQLLGWTWPPSYLGVLGKHDGVMVCDAILLSFLESFEIFLVWRETWRHQGYWPIGSDECGNYWLLDLAQSRPDRECPVLFLETMTGESAIKADSYSDFVVDHMARQCADVGCSTQWRT